MSKDGKRILRSVQKARAVALGEAKEDFVVHAPDKVNVSAMTAPRKLKPISPGEMLAEEFLEPLGRQRKPVR